MSRRHRQKTTNKKNQSDKLTISNLSTDCLALIFDWLDLATKMIVRLVCPQWNSLITYKESYQPLHLLHFILVLKKSLKEKDLLHLLLWINQSGSICATLIEYLRCRVEKTDFDEKRISKSKVFLLKLAVCAVEIADLGFLEWLNDINFFFSDSMCEIAAFNGHLEILEWLIDHGSIPSPKAFYLAIKGGHLNIIKFLIRRRSYIRAQCNRSDEAAAYYGRLEILQWLLKGEEYYDNYHGCLAAQGGHLHIIKWLHDNKYIDDSKKVDLALHAAITGQIKVLVWLEKNLDDPDYVNNEKLIDITARHKGKTKDEVRKWLNQNYQDNKYYQRKKVVCAIAAYHGQFETLQWLHEHDYPWDSRTHSAAKSKNHLEIVEWIEKQELLWSSEPTIPIDLNDLFGRVMPAKPFWDVP